MSKTRFNRPENWHSKPLTPEAVEGFESRDSRQQRKARAFAAEWKEWRIYDNGPKRPKSGPMDENGFMSRRVRRSIARSRLRAA
jgi:hypothetical protein